MAHSAKSLFDQNIESAEACLHVYDGVDRLGTRLEISWLLRASIVFSISAMDAYFHDKIKYRAGKYGTQNLPPALGQFQIPISGLVQWEHAERKGNVIRNWLTDHLSTRPLQRKDDIKQALKLVGIENLWATIEPDTPKRDELLRDMENWVKRRNQIAHEGDRESSRRSGKQLRGISKDEAKECINFVKDLVARVERDFPN